MRAAMDKFGEAPILVLLSVVLVIVGVVMLLAGIATASSGCIGTGLMWIGGGIIVGDFGGYLSIQIPHVLIGGGAGAVILLVGAAVRWASGC